MSLESIDQLDSKVENLIEAFKTLKQESESFRNELSQRDQLIVDLQNQNEKLAEAQKALNDSLEERQKKLDVAAGRIQDILRKLEPIQ